MKNLNVQFILNMGIKKLNLFRNFILSFILLSVIACNNTNEISFSTKSFNMSFQKDGLLSNLKDAVEQREYTYFNQENYLLGIQVSGKLEYPTLMEYSSEDNNIHLRFDKNDINAVIEIIENDNYFSFELVELSNEEIVELVLWGPFKTTIKETIGETIGVVRNKDYAIGIQGLNPRTLGGYPSSDDSTPSYNIFGTTSLVDVADSLDILYRGHTALPKDYGSALQAYTRNRANERVITTLSHENYIAPKFEDAGVVGSKIAFFGCRPDEVLNTIEKIELKEGLPHPMLNGVWAKRATEATAAYLIQDFDLENIDDAIDLTKRAGLQYLYHVGPFENWGHFDLKPDKFPNNWQSLKACVDRAKDKGIKVGVHTLSNFITTNDPYVTPVPDKRLASVGNSELMTDVSMGSKNIEIKDPTYFNQMKNNNLHAVVIGSEIIRYERVSDTAPWILLNCERGVFKTKVNSYKKGQKIEKLIDHAYKTFLSNTELSLEMSSTLAKLYNQTGLKQISFDGLEGNLSTGMGSYGELLFTKNWFDKLQPDIQEDYIMDASRPGHFFWHMFTRMNWGEPWYAGFRESQTSYRLLNQDYFRRNFIPCMLGWFSMSERTSIEDIEWMLARSAAFDAGYALLTSNNIIEKNGYGEEILEKIKQWEKARMTHAFSDDQKKRMEEIKAEFTLDTEGDGNWKLTPYNIMRFEHKLKVRQPGEPLWSEFYFKNNYEEQPFEFILTTTNKSTVSQLVIEIDDFKKIELDITLRPDEKLKYEGGNQVVLFDRNWNMVESIYVDPTDFILAKGEHQIKVDCNFSESDKASLKLELKTKGPKEDVSSNI